jgi:hypothetical protein
MYKRIENDREYFCAILPLVSLTNIHDHSTWRYPQPHVRILTFQSNIKDQCCKIIVPAMDKISEPANIEWFVKKQLANFTYTCAQAPGVSVETRYSLLM